MMWASPDGTGRNLWTRIGLTLFLSAMLLALVIAPAAAAPGLAEKLKGFKGKISYEYDWRINEP